MMKRIRERIVRALGGTMRTEQVAAKIYEGATLAHSLSAGRHKRIGMALDNEGIWIRGYVPSARREAHECIKWETVWLRPGWLIEAIRRMDKLMDQAWRESLKKDGVDDATR